MARLIDAMRTVTKLSARVIPLIEIGAKPQEVYDEVLRVIAEADTVDAVEVVHGWWIEMPSMEPDYMCSECGRTYAWWEPSEAHYCPNCGAKMDLGGGGDG